MIVLTFQDLPVDPRESPTVVRAVRHWFVDGERMWHRDEALRYDVEKCAWVSRIGPWQETIRPGV